MLTSLMLSAKSHWLTFELRLALLFQLECFSARVCNRITAL